MGNRRQLSWCGADRNFYYAVSGSGGELSSRLSDQHTALLAMLDASLVDFVRIAGGSSVLP